MSSVAVTLQKSLEIPIINISNIISKNVSPDRFGKTIEEIKFACREWGLFYVTGHGVDSELIRQLRAVTTEFFHKPMELKQTAGVQEVQN
jgi:isopenicillin N synthase-like dioxygenase